MKILTLNTWQDKGPWKERWELIFKGIACLKPDVIGFQEVFDHDWAAEVQKRTGYPHLVFIKDPGGEVFLSKYPVLDTESFTMKTKSPTEDYRRYVYYARLKAKKGPVAFFNTHLSWRIPESETRQNQVRELLAFMDTKIGTDPAFVMGDFNAAPDLPEIHQMLTAGWTDVYPAVHALNPGITWNNRNPYTAGSSVKMPDRRIDYIWMKDPDEKFVIKAAEVVLEEPEGEIYPSDHAGVFVELKEK